MKEKERSNGYNITNKNESRKRRICRANREKEKKKQRKKLPSQGLAPPVTALAPPFFTALLTFLIALPFLFFVGVSTLALGGGRPGIETAAGAVLFAPATLPAPAAVATAPVPGCVSSVKAE